MNTVFLNTAGRYYPALVFGSWQLGGAYQFGGKSDGLGEIAMDTASELLDRAYESGIRVLDTADIYGLGRVETLMSRLPEDAFIITKFGNRGTAEKRRKDFSPEYFTSCAENSRRRLSREPDLILMHNPPTDFSLDQLDHFELDRLSDEGLVKSFGISCTTVAQAEKALENRHVQAVEVNFNLTDRRAEITLFRRARELKKDLFLRAPYCSGFLTDRFLERDHEFEQNDRRSDLVPEDRNWRIRAARTMAESLGIDSIAETALRFCLSFPHFVVVGCRSIDQLETNIRYAASDGLDAATLQLIRQIELGDNPCW
jgi:aryl-alcohol dehydrogenase-like predicted oxidoreductase